MQQETNKFSVHSMQQLTSYIFKQHVFSENAVFRVILDMDKYLDFKLVYGLSSMGVFGVNDAVRATVVLLRRCSLWLRPSSLSFNVLALWMLFSGDSRSLFD